MHLYFVRHGESEANILRVISNRTLPHGLTETGRLQAIALAETLKSVPVTAIYSSPILRAVQTSEILSQALGVRFETTDALREYDCGVLEGRSDEEAWQQQTEIFRQWFTEHNPGYHFDGGESLDDIKARFVPFIDRLVEAHRYTEHVVILVGHGGAFYAMLPQILMNVSYEFALARPFRNTACVIAEFSSLGLVCREWAGEVITL